MGVPKAVPQAVPVSTGNDNVEVLTEPQLGPYKPFQGNAIVPVVPRSDDQTEKTLPPQPHFAGRGGSGQPPGSGSYGAPSVPAAGFPAFVQGPIDPHYQADYEAANPYGKVNNPPTRGMFTWVKAYLNHIARSQYTDTTGMKISPPQQRTSWMRITPPPHGAGFAPEIFEPRQMPQRDNTYKYNPSTGTDPYGTRRNDRYSTGVLNSDTFGAGQTAGGIGGNQYTPSPGPPTTTSTSGSAENPSGYPTWG